MDIVSVRPQPLPVPVAQFPLLQRSALIVGVACNRGRANLTAAQGAAGRVAAGEQLNLSGHYLPFRRGRRCAMS